MINKNEEQIKNLISKRLLLSKKKINIKYFHTLLIHNFEMLELNNQIRLFNVLKNLKKNKELSKIGFSIYDFEKLKQTLKQFKPDIIQCPYNIFDRRLDDINLKKIIRNKKNFNSCKINFFTGLTSFESIRASKKNF